MSETRARAVEVLREGPTTRHALAERLGITPQAVSYHITILRREGRVRVRWLGRSLGYEAVPQNA